MANQTTERYEANKHCEFDCFDLTLEDIYQYGCEFEFYINKSLDFKSTIIPFHHQVDLPNGSPQLEIFCIRQPLLLPDIPQLLLYAHTV